MLQLPYFNRTTHMNGLLQAGAVDKKVEEFGRVLHCQRLSVLKMAERYPQLLRMSPSELTQRLASIKVCKPWSSLHCCFVRSRSKPVQSPLASQAQAW